MVRDVRDAPKRPPGDRTELIIEEAPADTNIAATIKCLGERPGGVRMEEIEALYPGRAIDVADAWHDVTGRCTLHYSSKPQPDARTARFISKVVIVAGLGVLWLVVLMAAGVI